MHANRVSFSQLKQFIANAMIKLGLPPDDALKVGHIMAEADLQGSDGHGVIRLPSYAKRIKAGGINLNPSMKLVKEKAGMAVLDGDNAMGHLVMKHAAEIAIEKAKNCGIAWVGSRFSNHAGPAGVALTCCCPPTRLPLQCQQKMNRRWCSTWPPRSPRMARSK